VRILLSVYIKKNLGKFDLDISFEAENETLALLGASGSGKSMTLKCIAGIEKPDEGFISLNGRVLFDSKKNIDLSPRLRKVGYLFQQYALFPNMTVLRNVITGVRDKDKDKAKAMRKAREKLELMRLTGLEDKYPYQLSGGEQQRVALARILANEPELLLLDEPFSALDSYLRWQLELELAEIIAQYGGTVVYVSHNRDEVYRLSDSVCVLSEGRSEKKAPVKSLFDEPSTLSACLLTGCKNFSRIRRLDGNLVEALDWGTVLRVSKPVGQDAAYVGIRAHYLRPVSQPGENTVECTVERIIEDVFSVVVMLKTPGGKSGYSKLRLETGKDKLTSFAKANKIMVYMDPKDLMVLKE
jgi:molybdate transport system ATP-binding protein